ncbi:hypothetical protein WP50_00375, partial [Lactiplantibacillus plantarum]
MLKNGFNEIRSQMDYSQYGGAVLLGLKAPVVKTHGSSKAPTIVNTIRQIRQMVSTDYSQYGGAVLLGLKAPVVKTHGSSKAPTIVNTIRQIRQMVSTD